MAKSKSNKILILIFAALLINPCFLRGEISNDEGKISTFGSMGFILPENNIAFCKKLNIDSMSLKGWEAFNASKSENDLKYFQDIFKKYVTGGIAMAGVIETIETLDQKGEYLKKFPQNYQWYYAWVKIESKKKPDSEVSSELEMSAKLPAEADTSKGLDYCLVKDCTGLFEKGLNFDVLANGRIVPRENWRIDGDRIFIKGDPSRKYIAFIPCKCELVSLVPLDSQKSVCENLSKYLNNFKNFQYSYLWAEAVASMGSYCGRNTWPDSSPAMQRLFAEKTGLKFDPELVQLDPVYWREWINFKAEIVADAAKMIFDVYKKFKIKGSYYIGDCTFGGSCDLLGKAGLDYIWGNQHGYSHYWMNTFWGNCEDKPAYGLAYWPKNKADEARNLKLEKQFFRGAINQTIPDMLWIGFTSCHGYPDKTNVMKFHDINWKYKWVYDLLKKYKQKFIATAYIPSLGVNYYMPSLSSLFTKEGYLWDTPVKWKHIDLANLAKGEIPGDCDLLLLPSEPFMSGMIDEKCVQKIKKWVEEGHSLLVLRGATYEDIYGKERNHAPIREITGVDYARKKRGCVNKEFLKRNTEHWITKELPEKWTNETYRGSYRLGPSAQWFKGGIQYSLIRKLLPSWRDYPVDWAESFTEDVKILYSNGNNAPLLAVRELGKGRVAYLGQEHSLGTEFGHPLLQRTVYWLCKAEKFLPLKINNYKLDGAVYHKENDDLLTIYNPQNENVKTSIIPQINIDDKSEYIVSSLKLNDLSCSNVISSPKEGIKWNGSEIKKNGFFIDIKSGELEFISISKYNGQPLVSENSFIDPSTQINGFCSAKIKFADGKISMEEGNLKQEPVLELDIELLDAPPYEMPLYYLQKNKSEQNAVSAPWQIVKFGPERIKLHLAQGQNLILRYEGAVALEFIRGEIYSNLEGWNAEYDEDLKILSIEIDGRGNEEFAGNEKISFEETFSGDLPSNDWSGGLRPSSRIENRKLNMEFPGNRTGRETYRTNAYLLLNKSEKWVNYEIEAKIKALDIKSNPFIVFRKQSTKYTHYSISWMSGKVTLSSGFGKKALATGSSKIDVEKEHLFKITVKNIKDKVLISIYCDGKKELDFTDDENPYYCGPIGLFLPKGKAEISEFKVKNIK